MKRIECDSLIHTYGDRIFQKTYKGKFISHVLPVQKGANIHDIIYSWVNDLPLKNTLSEDWDVVVVFDYQDYLAGDFLDSQSLTLLLPEILEAK